MRTVCSSPTVTLVSSFTMCADTTPQRQHHTRVSSQFWPTKFGKPYNNYYSSTYKEIYHEYLLSLKVIKKALHQLANTYSALLMEDKGMKHTPALLWATYLCRMQQPVPCEILKTIKSLDLYNAAVPTVFPSVKFQILLLVKRCKLYLVSRLKKKEQARMVLWFAYGQRGSGKTET